MGDEGSAFSTVGPIALAGVLASGCGGPSNTTQSPLVSDSAGVRVVESPVPSDEIADWVLTAEPVSTIGTVDADGALYRVYSAKRLSDGSIIVSNSGTQEVRTYDAGGVLQSSFGREGMGPGEFSGISSMQILKLTAESITVRDAGNNRMNVYTRDGESVGTLTLTPVAGYGRPAAVGPLAGDEWVVAMPVGSGALGGNVGDRIEMSRALFRFDSTGTARNLITTLEARPRIVNDLGGGATHFPYVPLTSDGAYVAHEDAVLVSGADGAPEVRNFSADGTLRAIYRWAPPLVSVSEIWDRFSDVYPEGAGERRREAYERLVRMPNLELPEQVPVIEEMIVDSLGYIWVGQYRLPWSTDRSWHVLDPEGVWIGDLDTPERLTIFDIGRDYVAGRWVDDLGIETVRVYGLRRQPG